MNLHRIAASATRTVTPGLPAVVKQSAGYTTATDGSQVPAYTLTQATADLQALTGRDIERLNGLNVQGVTEKAYLTGNFEGVFRVLGKGGDLLVVNGRTYLVSAVLERWPDWCCVALTMQTDT